MRSTRDLPCSDQRGCQIPSSSARRCIVGTVTPSSVLKIELVAAPSAISSRKRAPQTGPYRKIRLVCVVWLDLWPYVKPQAGHEMTTHSTEVATFTGRRSEENTSELQSLKRISYAVFCLKKK